MKDLFMRGRLGRAAAVLTIAGLSVLGTATGASAASSDAWGCPIDARGCLFKHGGGTGDRYVIRGCGSFDLPRYWWDQTSSYRVQTARGIGLYSYKGRTKEVLVAAGGPRNNVGLTAAANDRADGVNVSC